MRVFSCDPGKTNYAWCCIDSKTLKILGVGKIKTPIHDLNNAKGRKLFKKEIITLLNKYKPHVIIIERFQNRGKFTGDQGECVSFGSGIIFDKADDKGITDFELICSMTWKVYFRKLVTDKMKKEILKEQYLKLRKSKRKRKPKYIKYKFEGEHLIESHTLSEHECDALLIGLYAIETRLNKKHLLWKLDDSPIRCR